MNRRWHPLATQQVAQHLQRKAARSADRSQSNATTSAALPPRPTSSRSHRPRHCLLIGRAKCNTQPETLQLTPRQQWPSRMSDESLRYPASPAPIRPQEVSR
jgi:hypothetical protein